MKKNLILLLVIFVCAVILADTGTVTLTSSLDRRVEEPANMPVWEYVITATYDSGDTGDLTKTVNINGILLKVILTVPNTSSAPTGQVVIKDNGNHTIFDSGEQVETNTYLFNVYEPLSGSIDIVIGPSGSTGTNSSDFVVTLRGI